ADEQLAHARSVGLHRGSGTIDWCRNRRFLEPLCHARWTPSYALTPPRPRSDPKRPLFDPVPILAWAPSMPPAWGFVALQVVGTVAAVLAAARRWPRVTFALAWLCYLVLAGFRGSRGKVLHNDL